MLDQGIARSTTERINSCALRISKHHRQTRKPFHWSNASFDLIDVSPHCWQQNFQAPLR